MIDDEMVHRPAHGVIRGQQLARKAQIAHMLERGWSVTQIAEELQCAIGTIQAHVRTLEQIWLDQIMVDVSRIKARKVAEYSAVKRAAWHAFDGNEGLMLDEESQIVESGYDDVAHHILSKAHAGDRGPEEFDFSNDEEVDAFRSAGMARVERFRSYQDQNIGTKSRGRTPGRRGTMAGASYLKIVLDAIQGEKDLLGLDAPKKSLNMTITPAMLRSLSDEQLDKLIAKTGLADILNDEGDFDDVTPPVLEANVTEIRERTNHNE
jgi:hypothetical protein